MSVIVFVCRDERDVYREVYRPTSSILVVYNASEERGLYRRYSARYRQDIPVGIGEISRDIIYKTDLEEGEEGRRQPGPLTTPPCTAAARPGSRGIRVLCGHVARRR